MLISTGRSLPSAAEFPFTPGSEGIGVVETVGPDIEDSTPGDKEKARVPGANLVHQPQACPTPRWCCSGPAVRPLPKRLCGRCGRHLVVGFVAGETPDVPANLMIMKAVSMIGVNLLRFNEECPRSAARQVRELLDLYNQRTLQVPSDFAAYGLDQLSEAMTHAVDRNALRRMVIDPKV